MGIANRTHIHAHVTNGQNKIKTLRRKQLLEPLTIRPHFHIPIFCRITEVFYAN